MTWVRNGAFYQLRLERGEEVLETLAGFVKEQRIRSGFLTGLGAAEDIVLGLFDPRTRAYRKRTFRGDHEIAGLVGNIAWHGGQPICHVHATISTPRLTAFAGHLFSARVTVTCEVALLPGTRKLIRSRDPATGLNLLALTRPRRA